MTSRALLLGVLALGGCGDDGGSSGETANMPGATSTTSGDSGDTSAPDPDDGGTTAGPSVDSSDGPSPTSTDGSDTGPPVGSGTSDGGSTTGVELPDGQWAMTELSYSDGVTTEMLSLSDCTFCDATLNAQTLLVRYQQAEGWTVWSIDIPIGSGVGAQPITDDYSGAYVAINEQSPDLPPDFTGFYAPTSATGTLTLTQADITPGGAVAGTLSTTLTLDGVTAVLDAEFYAEIPAG
ncbi:MAG: hypothetical protein AAF721_35210 [Myxococcota bacterium]